MRRSDAFLLVALVAVGCAVTIVWGERILVHHGEGWDGQAYTAWARAFPNTLRYANLTQYYAQRVLPSATIYYALELLRVPHTRDATLLAFQLLDACALVATAVLLVRIAAALAWSRMQLWAAAAATFLAFAIARHALYYPALTDTMAYALATGAVWAYVTRRPIALAVIALASCVTWPALLGPSLAALVFPRAGEAPPPASERWTRRAALVLGIAAAVFVTAWLVEELVNPYETTERWLAESHQTLWPLTIACIVLPVAAAAYVVAREPRTWGVRAYLASVGARRLVLGAAAAVAIVVARHWWITRASDEPGMDLRAMQHLFAALAVRAPLFGIVHHVVYFGPIVIVVLLAWRRIASVAAAWGPGAVLVLGIAVVSAVTTESRQLAHVMPFVIVIAISATAWTPRGVLVFAALALAWSKLWWPLGDGNGVAYTMQQGPWAPDSTFLIHLAAAVATAAFVVTARLGRTSPDTP